MIGRRRPPISTSPPCRDRPRRHAVGVPERDRRDGGVAWRARGAARRTARSPAGEPLDERHPRPERQHRPQVGGQVVDAGARRDAVDRDPGAHERVRGRRGCARRAGRVGGVHDDPSSRPGSAASTLVEPRQLVGGVRVVDGSSATARWVNMPASRSLGRAAAMRRDEVGDVGGGGADAVHPGVDLEVDVEVRRPSPTRGQRVDPGAW